MLATLIIYNYSSYLYRKSNKNTRNISINQKEMNVLETANTSITTKLIIIITFSKQVFVPFLLNILQTKIKLSITGNHENTFIKVTNILQAPSPS